MNAITLHAIGLARSGQWRLLDALEVIVRARSNGNIAGILHAPGSIPALGLIADDHDGTADANCNVECPECDGDGEIQVEGATGRSTYIDCPWCDGDGRVDQRDATCNVYPNKNPKECKSWSTLNGGHIADPGMMASDYWTSVASAHRIVKEYSGLVEALCGERSESARPRG